MHFLKKYNDRRKAIELKLITFYILLNIHLYMCIILGERGAEITRGKFILLAR